MLAKTTPRNCSNGHGRDYKEEEDFGKSTGLALSLKETLNVMSAHRDMSLKNKNTRNSRSGGKTLGGSTFHVPWVTASYLL